MFLLLKKVVNLQKQQIRIMQTQLVLNIDNQTAEFANFYAKEKGQSINELFENYIRLIVLNEQLLKYRTLDLSNFSIKSENPLALKRTNWKELDSKFSKIRKGLPVDYKFDREFANER